MNRTHRTRRAVAAAAATLVLATTGPLLTAGQALAARGQPRARSCTGLGAAWLNTQAGSHERAQLERVMFSSGCDSDRDGLLTIWETELYGTDPNVPDTDGDLLPDGSEVLTHLTNPLDPDTDGDSLIDGWEINGLPNGTVLPGAKPRRADIYVEMDYMVRHSATNGLAWNGAVLTGIEEMFANAPRLNPDGSTGIDIHLEPGNEVPYRAVLNPYTPVFDAIRDAYFDPRRRAAYHYMIWANAHGTGTSSGISTGIPAPDFLVTLGLWNEDAGGTNAQKIGTFVHELGHNLGQRHGGNDNVNWKPNYLSVMNYFFQVKGVPSPSGRVYDYQRFDLPNLNEAALDEAKGLDGGREWLGYGTLHYCPNGVVRPGDVRSIDWNCDGVIAGIVAVDVDGDDRLSVLGSRNNWANLVFNGGGVIGSTAETATLRTLLGVIEQRYQSEDQEPELTWEQHQELSSAD